MQEQWSTPVYGKHAVEELLKSGKPVDTLWLAEGLDEKQAGYFIALAKNAGAVVKRVHAAKLEDLSDGGTHQGVAAAAALVEYVALEDLLDVAKSRGEDPFLLLADGIQDPHNLGALMRTALLCGVHGVVLPKRGGTAITATAYKASAGAAALLPAARVANLGEAVRKLKKLGIFVYCADTGGRPPFKENLRGPLALVMGAEGRGVSPLIQKLCDGALALPMAPGASGIDSFNVSVAGGIVMYEIFRQRKTDG